MKFILLLACLVGIASAARVFIRLQKNATDGSMAVDFPDVALAFKIPPTLVKLSAAVLDQVTQTVNDGQTKGSANSEVPISYSAGVVSIKVGGTTYNLPAGSSSLANYTQGIQVLNLMASEFLNKLPSVKY